MRKREKHAGEGVLEGVTLRDGDGGRLLARLTHRVVDFSKHTCEGAEKRLHPVSGLSRGTFYICCLLLSCLVPTFGLLPQLIKNK